MKLALLMAMAVVVSTGADTPALFESGRVPTLAVNSDVVGGGEVLLEVSLDAKGGISGIKPLRETAPFTGRMVDAVRSWKFSPAEVDIPPARRKPGGPTTEGIESKVLVAGVFRAPAVIGATLGEVPKDVARVSAEIPFPTSVVTPTYPAGTMAPGVVLVEVKVDARGDVTAANVRVPAAGFDSTALTTARQWKFRPARPAGGNSASVAYIVFGFQVPKG
ncbi:MAG TPA: energy transducer TonB [Vicinamibacterales bacterium]|nr:energy transducer TonB [Vicinamibacterales bacterium]